MRRTVPGVWSVLARSMTVVAVCVGVAATASAKPLSQSSPLTGTWTSGPTKMVFVRDTDAKLWVYQDCHQRLGCGWYDFRYTDNPANMTDRAVPVVIQTSAGWETHVFYATGTEAVGNRKIVHA